MFVSSQTVPFLNNIDELSDKTFNSVMENETKLNYCDFSPLQVFKKRDHELLVLHVNIRFLLKNFDDLCQLICQFKHPPDIICLSETRLKDQVPINVNINEYNFVNANSPTNAGGVRM